MKKFTVFMNTVVLVSSLVASAGAQEIGTKENPAVEGPRYLYGCGIIWAKWIWDPEDRSKWDYDAKQMDLIKAMGGTNVPIDIQWNRVEPEPGKWYFDYVDHAVKAAEERDLPKFAYMGLTPDWALDPEIREKYNQPGIGYRFPPPEERREEFIRYCKTVAKRYKGRIEHYQFWNEPNGCSWINDGCGNAHMFESYTYWLKIWYEAMKSEDPDAILGAGALDMHQGVKNGESYLEGMYKFGAKGYFDAFNIHPYDSQGTLHHAAIEGIRRVMVENGDGHKGIWVSEWGWSTKDEDLKARRIHRTLKELEDPKYHYVTMANYLSLTDPTGEPGYGLCERDLTPRKSYLAFKSHPKKIEPEPRGRKSGSDERQQRKERPQPTNDE